jgi:hypothetical protein
MISRNVCCNLFHEELKVDCLQLLVQTWHMPSDAPGQGVAAGQEVGDGSSGNWRYAISAQEEPNEASGTDRRVWMTP